MLDLFFENCENLNLDSLIPIRFIQLFSAISKIFLAFINYLLSIKNEPKEIKY